MAQRNFQVEGRLAADPEMTMLSSGTALVKFTVVEQERHLDKGSGEWVDDEPAFWNCTAFGKLAENVAESVQRGNRVLVIGRLSQREYESKTGEKRRNYEVRVDYCGVSLKWDAVKVLRMDRASNGAVSTSPADDPWATASPNRPNREEEPAF